MQSDKYGRQILSENDLCDIFLRNPEQNIRTALMDKVVTFDDNLELTNLPTVLPYEELSIPLTKFDEIYQSRWYIPNEYATLDIAKWVLDQCKSDPELQRVGEELLKYQELEMFPILRYCKYLVDTMRKNNVVWGVGRGSSVSSYVLYLIGIHRINSLHYDLSIDEFLK